MEKACTCDTWQAMCVTHDMPCVNMHGSFEAYIRGFTWDVLTSKGVERRRRGKGKEKGRKGEEKKRKGKEKGRNGKEKGKKKREEERGGKEEKERGKGRSIAQ